MKLFTKIFLLCNIFTCGYAADVSTSNPLQITQQQKDEFKKDIEIKFENFFHTKIDIEHMDSYMAEKRQIFYQKLSTCQPGVYRYGYLDMFPIFVTSTISGFQNGKCIEDSVHVMGATLPLSSDVKSTDMIVHCQFQKDSLQAFTDPYLFSIGPEQRAAELKLKPIYKNECQSFFNGKQMNF